MSRVGLVRYKWRLAGPNIKVYIVVKLNLKLYFCLKWEDKKFKIAIIILYKTMDGRVDNTFSSCFLFVTKMTNWTYFKGQMLWFCR